MTHEEIRRRALHAAATVVLAFGPACIGSEKEDDSSSSADDSVADSSTDSPADSTTDSPTDSTTDSVATGEPDCNAEGVDMTTCCDERMTWCGEQFDPSTEAYATCVWGPGYDGSTGCIPWGPAAPPRARRLA